MKNTLIILGVIVALGLIYMGVKSMYGPSSSSTSSNLTDNGGNIGEPSTIPTSSSGLPMGLPANLIPPSPTASSELGNGQTVSISGFKFVPNSLTVKQGGTVIFTNNDSVAHTVTATTFDSGSIQPGGSFSQVFSTKGTFTYKCTIHPTMTGTIIVQ